MSLKGLEQVVANLNKEIKAIEGRSLAGLIRAAIVVRRRMDEVPPLIPISPGGGHLRASWTTDPGYKGNNPFITLKFTQNYAVYVHEMMDRANRKINWSRPGSGPKFFQAALRGSTAKIMEVIRQEAMIK
jgi:hypothetical protein